MKIPTRILPLLLASPLMAQTIQIPAVQIQLPGVVEPSQSVTITCPKNGGKVTFTLPQRTLLNPSQAATPASTVPVNISAITLNFTCTGPDMQHLVCSAVKP